MLRERSMLYFIIIISIILSKAPKGNGIHPVSIARFPLTRFSPGSGLLRNRFCSLVEAQIFQGLGPKDGNLVTETGCRGNGF